MKKLFASVLLIMFAVILSCPSYAAEKPLLADHADVLTNSEEEEILSLLSRKSDELDFDIAVLTEETIGGADIVRYSEDYFIENGLGRGDDLDGILLTVVLDTREYYMTTSGFGPQALGDEELYYIENAMLGGLSAGDYAAGIRAFAEKSAYYVGYAKEYGHDFSDDGYYTYDNDRTEKVSMPIGQRIFICVAVGAIVGLMVVLAMRGKMNTVHKKTTASDYVRRDSFELIGANDVFLNKTVSRTPRVEATKSGGSTHHGGGSTHIGSSGHSFGGKGGHF